MSRSFRSMKDVLPAIHKAVGAECRNCSPAWKAVRERIRTDAKTRTRFLKALKQSLP